MPDRWRVVISGSGPITREEGGRRISVPHGEYTMTENAPGEYELASQDGLTFPLSLREVAQYKQNGTLKFPDSDWP